MDASYLDLVMAQQEESFEEASGGGGVWVVADLLGGRIAPVTLEAVGAARSLADALGAYVYAVLLGADVAEQAPLLYQAGADGVRMADDPDLEPFAVEPYVEILADLFAAEEPEIVLLSATNEGQALAPRLAQRLSGGLIEHVTAVQLDEGTRAVEAAIPVYGGEYFEIRACPETRPQFLTVQPGAFARPFMDEYRQGDPTQLDVEVAAPRARVIGPAKDFDPPEIPLSEATVVVAGGRQAGDFTLVQALADRLDAHLAGDRGAWDAGLVDAAQMADVRGVSVAPQVYVAVGIRGDTFHHGAIEEARFIVAIHPDRDPPIFAMADLCVQADPEAFLPELLEALS